MRFFLVRVADETYPVTIPDNAPIYGLDHRGYNIPLTAEDYLIQKFATAFAVDEREILLKEIE